MIRVFKGLFLPARFFYGMGLLVALLSAGFVLSILFPVAQALMALYFLLVVTDIFLLSGRRESVTAIRSVSRLLSLGSENVIRIEIENPTPLTLKATVMDELPYQLQRRDFKMHVVLRPFEKKTLTYTIRPVERGVYHFGCINIFIRSVLGLAERRIMQRMETTVPVYPSVMEMKKYELMAFASIARFQGIKKVRKIGQSFEFEQIRNYVSGDDYRTINWKATSRKAELMVNQFEDEKSQQIYSLIDNSRSMRLPFNDLTLFDYAINTSLVISNVVLNKQDKAGLITFAGKIGTTLKAEKGRGQLKKILEALYSQRENMLESNYEMLYAYISKFITGRSLIFLYTNFESIYALHRVLPVLRRINKQHLLVTVFFENTEVKEYGNQPSVFVEDIYLHTIARNFAYEKQQIVQELRQYGIQSILTAPENLSINTVNKYLELKARRMI